MKKPAESAAYITRSAHPNGAIIVTGDATGCIKVFRQDCAYEKRLQWDTSSISRKQSSTDYLRRHSSITSSRGNLTRQGSTSTSISHDRVLSWRQGIASTSSLETANGSKRSTNGLTETRSHRIGLFGRSGTHSPKLDGASTSNRDSSFDTTSVSPHDESSRPSISKQANSGIMPPPPPPSYGNPAIFVDGPPAEQDSNNTTTSPDTDGQSQPQDQTRPTIDTRTSSMNSATYWRRDAWRDGMLAQLQESNSRHKEGKGNSSRGGTLGPLSRQGSAVSRLTDEISSNDE